MSRAKHAALYCIHQLQQGFWHCVWKGTLESTPKMWVPRDICKPNCISSWWNVRPCIMRKCSINKLNCLNMCKKGQCFGPDSVFTLPLAMLDVAFGNANKRVHIQTRHRSLKWIPLEGQDQTWAYNCTGNALYSHYRRNPIVSRQVWTTAKLVRRAK